MDTSRKKREGVFAIFQVKLGWMGLVGEEKGIERIFLPVLKKEKLRECILSEFPEYEEKNDFLIKAQKMIKEYFSGQRVRFEFPLDFSRATSFQKRVYRAMASIPYGEVRTYLWLAGKIGNRRAVRAVGGASAQNRWPLVIPCHRVVGNDGHLTGFSAPGGLALKARLLRIEGIPIPKAMRVKRDRKITK